MNHKSLKNRKREHVRQTNMQLGWKELYRIACLFDNRKLNTQDIYSLKSGYLSYLGHLGLRKSTCERVINNFRHPRQAEQLKVSCCKRINYNTFLNK